MRKVGELIQIKGTTRRNVPACGSGQRACGELRGRVGGCVARVRLGLVAAAIGKNFIHIHSPGGWWENGIFMVDELSAYLVPWPFYEGFGLKGRKGWSENA